MKYLKQFVFYGEDNNKNFPNNLTAWTHNLLSAYAQVSHLGIQGIPGTTFYLNQNGDPITIGITGVYEIDLQGVGFINKLSFDRSILLRNYNNNPNPDHRLIVDIVYEGVKE